MGLTHAVQTPLSDDFTLDAVNASVVALDTRGLGHTIGVDRSVAAGDLPPVIVGSVAVADNLAEVAALAHEEHTACVTGNGVLTVRNSH